MHVNAGPYAGSDGIHVSCEDVETEMDSGMSNNIGRMDALHWTSLGCGGALDEMRARSYDVLSGDSGKTREPRLLVNHYLWPYSVSAGDLGMTAHWDAVRPMLQRWS